MNLNKDFREFLQFLNSNDVRYLVIGGYAVAAHGHVRYTKDIDVWVEQTKGNSERLMRALGEFGFGSTSWLGTSWSKRRWKSSRGGVWVVAEFVRSRFKCDL